MRSGVCFFLGLLVGPLDSRAQQPPATAAPKRPCAEIEAFMLKAKMGPRKNVPRGVTAPQRATLDDGNMQHEVFIQTIDESKSSFQSARGTELNFRDTWKHNVSAYELAKILELNMIPPYVERNVGGKTGSLSWGLDNVLMDELDRTKKKADPPNLETWNPQMYVVRVFDQLIHNVDRNLTNLMITQDWQMWMIDHSRAFRLIKNIPEPKNLVKCDRKLLAKLRTLNNDELVKKLSRWMTKSEIEALHARAGKIVEFFDKEVAQKGEAAVLFDLDRSGVPCAL